MRRKVADTPDAPSYAYAFEWSGYYAPRALNRVLSAGVLARVAPKNFVAQTTRGAYEFSRGSIIVSFDRQEVGRGEIENIMNDIERSNIFRKPLKTLTFRGFSYRIVQKNHLFIIKTGNL